MKKWQPIVIATFISISTKFHIYSSEQKTSHKPWKMKKKKHRIEVKDVYFHTIPGQQDRKENLTPSTEHENTP